MDNPAFINSNHQLSTNIPSPVLKHTTDNHTNGCDIELTSYQPLPNGERYDGTAQSCLESSVECEQAADVSDVAIQGQDPDESPKAAETIKLFRFADRVDVLLMVIGTLGSIVAGTVAPFNFYVFGDILNQFVLETNSTSNNATAETGIAVINIYRDLYFFCINAVAALVAGYVAVAFWCWAAQRQMRRIRETFFKSILRQDMKWFDTHDAGELNVTLSENMNHISDGLGDKVGIFIQWIATSLAGFTMALVQSWKLGLATLAFSPLMMLSSALISWVVRNIAGQQSKAYAQAGSVVEEVLSAIRTVTAFQGQEREYSRYVSSLQIARKVGLRKGIVMGFGIACFWVISLFSFALAFWYGLQLLVYEGLQQGIIVQVLFGVFVGSMALGQALPFLETFSTARGAAAAVFTIVDQVPDIDVMSVSGMKPDRILGRVEFCDVFFAYPARPDVPVLVNFSLTLSAGQTVAVVGDSGSGKSTIVHLLQRMYDPDNGQIFLDGIDIRELDVRWLRQQIGVVSQDPILFGSSIRENIAFGTESATWHEIVEAAKIANAHDFIRDMPKSYSTLVGERGTQLSGGQTQRVVIARALIRNPTLLLLDEATSALDNENEALVKATLEKACVGRTTIMITHRLSAIKNADIVVLRDGTVVDRGSHSQLLAKGGYYQQLVASQLSLDLQDDDDDTDVKLDSPLDNFNFEYDDVKHNIHSSKSTSRLTERRQTMLMSDFWKRSSQSEEAPAELALPSIFRILSVSSPDWPYILLGCLASILLGGVHPGSALIMSELFKVFTWQDREKQSAMVSILCGVLVGQGLVLALLRMLQTYCFAVSGENLTIRMRSSAFKALLRQDISFFDNPRNQVGALTSRLSNDATAIQGATGAKIGLTLEAFSSLTFAVIIAFVFGWKLAFVVTAFLPVTMIGGILQGRMLTGFAQGDKGNLEKAGLISYEAIDSIRTVASLTKENYIHQKYSEVMDALYWKGRRKAHLYGLTNGFVQSVVYFSYAAAFAYGAHLVQNGEMEFYNVFRVFLAIGFGASTAGRTSSYAPDFAKAKVAAARLFALFDTKGSMNSWSGDGKKLECCTGKIEFRDVMFSYPSRSSVTVVKSLSLQIHPGQTLALVGMSGCGKSTLLHLLERFYDPQEGHLLLDNIKLDDFNIKWMRSQIGIVSQTPVLFDCSIADNIAYGDLSTSISLPDIIQAAEKANIHQFIQSLPSGYDTNVGDKGTQLSGGQKQRIAIARALLRNPRILLLDEATSALDSGNEQAVQEALDIAREGRTCIVVTHRLSTIQNSDKIVVMDDGLIIEQGTHTELLKLGGMYHRLLTTSDRKHHIS